MNKIKHKNIIIISFKLFINLFLSIFIINLYVKNVKIKKNNKLYQYIKYDISNYKYNNLRYNFHDEFKKRKIFNINYSYIPYSKIKKKHTYEENANKIYKLTGMLNVTKLDYYYYNKKLKKYSNYNHIHLSTAFDKDYIYLSSVSFASILNTSNPNTFIHFHLIILDSKFEDMKKIIKLKKINNNVEFIFYNGKQAVYDFGSRSKKEFRGVGDCAKMLIPEIVNGTNKVIIMDSGDILAQKDLSEVFFFDLEDNYFAWTLEYFAGNPKGWHKFSANKFYPNGGICLVNVTLFRKDRLYERAFFTSMAYDYLQGPYQDIYFLISVYKFKYFPLNYNCKQFFDNDEQIIKKKKDTKYIKFYLKNQKFSPFKYKIEEIFDASLDPVIIHIYHEKVYRGTANKKYTEQWINYVKLTGFYREIKKKYPKPFKIYENS